MLTKRIKRIQEKLEELRLDGLLISHLPNVRYLTGFSGTNGSCLVKKDGGFFLTDFRYEEQSHQEVKGLKIAVAKSSFFDELEKRKLLRGLRRVGIEGNYLPYSEYQKLKKAFPRVSFLPQADVVESISSVKEEGEIEFQTKATIMP